MHHCQRDNSRGRKEGVFVLMCVSLEEVVSLWRVTEEAALVRAAAVNNVSFLFSHTRMKTSASRNQSQEINFKESIEHETHPVSIEGTK